MSDSSNQTKSVQLACRKPSAKAAQSAADGAVFVDKDGNQSNWLLAEQMLEGVDELKFQQASAAQWIKDGCSPKSAFFSLGLTLDGSRLRSADDTEPYSLFCPEKCALYGVPEGCDDDTFVKAMKAYKANNSGLTLDGERQK